MAGRSLASIICKFPELRRILLVSPSLTASDVFTPTSFKRYVAPCCCVGSSINQVSRIEHVQKQRLPRHRKHRLWLRQVKPACRKSHAPIVPPQHADCFVVFKTGWASHGLPFVQSRRVFCQERIAWRLFLEGVVAFDWVRTWPKTKIARVFEYTRTLHQESRVSYQTADVASVVFCILSVDMPSEKQLPVVQRPGACLMKSSDLYLVRPRSTCSPSHCSSSPRQFPSGKIL